ncbi:MAG: hypothetical protein C5B54_06310 [Acidobacteria bacterium]|nr:MAG: hypothetical protein C5B54_06310 [Acidobacteriota bacterium]
MSLKIGKYDVLEILGRGGMGVVYKAYDPILDREVALKTMTSEGLKDPVLRERFYREARAAGKLRHANIVTIYELGEENNVPYIAMEYIHGTDVHHLIRMRTEVTMETKFRILIQLLRGLSYAHKAGIVHRDIKPSNIRLSEDYQVKILDFGIARLVTAQTMTTNGMVLGTIQYMSPEQIRGVHVDRKSDIFSAGIIFYEMLCYRKPFEADNTATILYKLVHEPPDPMVPPIDEQFPVVKRVLFKSLDKDPARRYFSADEMADDLEEFLRTTATLAQTGKATTVEYDRNVPTEEIVYPPPGVEQKQTDGPRPATDPRITDLLRTARRMIVDGHSVQALSSLREALNLEPTNPEATNLAYMVEQDIKRSEVDELLRQGQEYLREKRYDIAQKAFEKILKINPNNTKARMLMEAVRSEMNDPNFEDLLTKAKNAYGEKKYQLAMKYVEDVLKISPQQHEALEIMQVLKERLLSQEFSELLQAGENFLREQQYETAIKALEKALKIFPQHPVALKRLQDAKSGTQRTHIEQLILMGNKQLELGNFEDAYRSFEEILKMDPKNETAKMVLAYIGEKLRVEEVKQLLNTGWRIFMMDKQYDEVIRIAEKILTLDPSNGEAVSLIQSARKEKGDV